MAKPIIEAIKYVAFFHLELFSICFRFNDDIIDEANGCKHDICNLRIFFYMSLGCGFNDEFMQLKLNHWLLVFLIEMLRKIIEIGR